MNAFEDVNDLGYTVPSAHDDWERPIYLEPLAALAISGLVGWNLWLQLNQPFWSWAMKSGVTIPAVTIAGFGADDSSWEQQRQFLSNYGIKCYSPRLGPNTGCFQHLINDLTERLGSIQRRHHGQRIAILGHSRGGVLAKMIARLHPELVAGAVYFASPIGENVGIHPLVKDMHDRMVRQTQSRHEGAEEECMTRCVCAAIRSQQLPQHPRVKELSFVALADGVLDPKSCYLPRGVGKNVPVWSTHSGLTAHIRVLYQTLFFLKELALAEAEDPWEHLSIA